LILNSKLKERTKYSFNNFKRKYNYSIKIRKVLLLFIFLITIFLILSPVSAKVFVTDSSHGIMTAPAAHYTNNQLILSSITPEKSVLNYLSGQNVIVVGDLSATVVL